MDSTIPLIDISSDDESEAFQVLAGTDGDRNSPTKILETVNCDSYDDCAILDVDPDEPVLVSDSGDINRDDDDDDEVMVIGENGQIACRDYPHPRHNCVKFPFASSPHDKLCEKCHCYVCDSLSPCASWSSHCHANGKEKKWTTLRRKFRRLSEDATESVSRASAASNRNGTVTRSNQVIASPRSNLRSHSQVPVETTIRTRYSSVRPSLSKQAQGVPSNSPRKRKRSAASLDIPTTYARQDARYCTSRKRARSSMNNKVLP